MSDNLFEHGKSSQTDIIKPYIQKIRTKIGSDLSYDNIEFFLSQLRSCLVMLEEHESVPKWVKDFPMYRMKSEIFTFLSLFSALKIIKDPTSEERDQLHSLYRRVRELGEDKKWDLQVLHIQFIRVMGTKVQNYIIKLVIPRKLDRIDYN